MSSNDADGQYSSLDLTKGKVNPNVTGASLLPSNHVGEVTIMDISSSGTITGLTGEHRARARDTATVDYRLTEGVSSDGSRRLLNLGYLIDYSGVNGVSLGANGDRFASFLSDSTVVAGATLIDGSNERDSFQNLVTSVLNARDGRALETIYAQNSLDEAAIGVSSAQVSSLAMLNLLQSCPKLGPVGSEGFFKQQNCNWVRALGRNRHQSQTGSNPGYDQNTSGMAVGRQQQLPNGMFFEFGGQYERSNLSGDNFSQDGFIFSVGAALKREVGNLTFSGSAVAGFYETDYDRQYTTTEGRFLAQSKPKGRFLAVEARVAGLSQRNGFYGKPALALSVNRTWQDSFGETGTGQLNWQVDSLNQTSVALRPSIEFGRAFSNNGKAGVAFLRTGITGYLTEQDYDVTARLADLGTGFPDLTSVYSDDRFIGDVALGMNVDLQHNLTFSGLLQGSFSDNTHALGAFANLTWKF